MSPAASQPLPSADVREAVAWATARLVASGADVPRLASELLACRAFGLTRLELLTRRDQRPGLERLAAFSRLVERREAGEPTAYILGQREFFGLVFAVTPDVLIPRPETELIVEQALRLFQSGAPLAFADFGTGSGALAVTIAHEFPNAHGLAVDISPAALDVARSNARFNGVEERLEFRLADFMRMSLPPASLDLVVANPPYVTEDEHAALAREVRDFEPRLALVSPECGLAHLRGLLPVAAAALRPGGMLLCELGCGQGARALSLAADAAPGLCDAVILKDHAGLDRILLASRAKEPVGVGVV
ncbi:MAG: protein-(glutamine-N5) methyltransferase, release factor-specific [Desulfovibrionaceae bacterium CG1_02_65_16]|nr:MAG: protein-(glutamine-N5) methyltransferase, release factor-specific [Desulfovibrionaceae bacterium CG1_02_65_16]